MFPGSIVLIILILLGALSTGAQTWKNVGPDSTNLQMLTLRTDSVLFAGIPNRGIVRSIDHGSSWSLVDSADEVTSLAYSPNGHLFAGLTKGTYNGIHRSTDGGLSWQPKDNVTGAVGVIHTFAFDVGGSVYAGGSQPGILISTDDGGSWNRMGFGIAGGEIWALAVAGSGALVAGTDDGIYRSTNGGGFWTQVNDASHVTTPALFAIDDGRTFAGTTSNGLYYSSNSGATWSSVSAGLTSTSVIAIVQNVDGIFFAATPDSGIFRSENGGSGWSPFNDGLTNLNINTMVIDQNGFLYAGSAGSGLFQTNESTVLSVREISNRIPDRFTLAQNYPNPFNPTTKLEFQIRHRGFVTLKIYNILGNEIATLVSEELQPGTYSTTWNASGYPSGVYFSRLQSGSVVQSRKIVLLR